MRRHRNAAAARLGRLIVLFAGASSAVQVGCASSSVCDSGRTVACACLGGMTGVQTCRNDGSGYSACECPNSNPDGGTSTSPDAGSTNPDARVPVGADCVFPKVDSTVAPTSGYCDQGAAVVCDPATGKMARTPCAATAACEQFDVDQMGSLASIPPTPGYRYTWASCVPTSAERCAYSYVADQRSWTPTAGRSTRCSSERTLQTCRMRVPLLTGRGPGFPFNAGSADGYWEDQACLADETCRAQDGDRYACTVGSTKCSRYGSTCDGEGGRLDCRGEGLYPERIACEPGTVCRKGCGTATGADACLPVGLVTATGLCSPGAASVCSTDHGAVLRCDTSCFERDGACVCNWLRNPCMGDMTCVERKDSQGTYGECGYDVDCTAGNRCEGTRAIRCANDRAQVFDCAQWGMSCAQSGSVAGCVSGTEACAQDEAACTTNNEAVVCCASDGQAFFSIGTFPCVPDRLFKMECPSGPGASYDCVGGDCRYHGP